MTREELEQAIENGESVWIIGKDIAGKKKIGTKALCKYDEVLKNKLNGFWNLNKIFKTKAEAEHYLHHANITRVEQLPFLTWEEFNKDTLGFDFTDNIGNKYRCHIVRDYRDGKDFIVLYDKNGTISVDEEWETTEENFYRAYDECVRLFRGEV